MTTTHTNIAIVEGEVNVMEFTQIGMVVIASTAKIEGIPQLDRKHFVKPKVDVEKLAIKHYPELRQSQLRRGFKAGYNAKEAEFDLIEVKEMMKLAFIQGQQNRLKKEDVVKEILKLYMPLELPKSVTLNENNEVIDVQW